MGVIFKYLVLSFTVQTHALLAYPDSDQVTWLVRAILLGSVVLDEFLDRRERK